MEAFFALCMLMKLISRATVIKTGRLVDGETADAPELFNNASVLTFPREMIRFEPSTEEPVIKGSTVMNCLPLDAPTLVTATALPWGWGRGRGRGVLLYM